MTEQPIAGQAMTISLCMIVKNEEQTLGRCLDSVADLMDEIIIVDTGSTDQTKSIAARYTDRLYTFDWDDDFAAARNTSFDQATCSYIMWLDADDVLLGPDRERLRSLKQRLSADIDAVVMPLHLAEGEQGELLFTSRRIRLVKRERQYRWEGRLHEELMISEGRIVHSDVAVTHRRMGDHTLRNQRILARWISESGKLEGRLLYFYANECFDRKEYAEAAEAFNRLLAEPSGYREDRITACARLAECYLHLGKPEQQLDSLLRSFRYGVPQADLCCMIGDWFFTRNEWSTAAYWYEKALEQQHHATDVRPVSLPCYSWLPHVRLSHCHAHLGQLDASYEHNRAALRYLPDDPHLLANDCKLREAIPDRSATAPPSK
ncbi:glycosyltransferase family 2 protein [Paenibacillus sp. BJ-4]|uniref:glycosyltransferase family 2 protein n=1 Tax=Paenibacillus sp. BJ-4 TaxID=2878097 RepID=UPI001CF0975D|nr:glycosyltransferase family 2 protein [Paenibacillus sp. BJ-4]